MDKEERYSAPALDKGLSMLEYLSKIGGSRSQKEIAVGIGQKPNSIFRMLAVLERRGYIVREEKSGKYRLSLLIYHLAHTYAPLETLRHIAIGPMDELAESTGHSCHLSTLFNGQVLILAQSRPGGPVSLMIEEGSLFPVLRTESGRVLLAFAGEARRSATLEANAEFQEMSKEEQDEFLSQLNVIRSAGLSVARSEITPTVTDHSAFIGFSDSSLVAALAVSRIVSDITLQPSNEVILEQLISTARKINDRLGAHPGLCLE